jgi:Family of unknown function (DUF5689)
MKKYNFKSLLLSTIIIATSVSCVNESFTTPNTDLCESIPVTKIPQDFTSISTATYQQYLGADTDVIEAVVTSSDEGGNFYKSISFESVDKGAGTVGFSMPIDQTNLNTEFEPGRKVFIKINNLYFAKSNGSTILGELYDGDTPTNPADDAVGRISFANYKNIIRRSCDKPGEEAIVKKNVSIAIAKNDTYLNKLIEFDGVQFLDASVGKKYFDPTVNNLGGATNHQITDENGNRIIVRISEFATFAEKTITNKNGKIRGVLTKFGSDYQFMVRTENDIKLTDDRKTVDLNPPRGGTAITYSGAFTENFESYTAGSSSTGQTIFPKYVNDPFLGSKYWYVATFSANKYLVMSAFTSTVANQDQDNLTYFVMPVDFTAANSMSFKTQDRFNNGAVLKVYYSTDYIPLGKISNATLTNISSNFTIASGTTTGTTVPFVNSGVYNFPSTLTGNGFIIFEYSGGYKGSNPDLTTTIHLDDIVIN